ncbi:MAG: precorrin-6A reductase [Lachnospiraceae bacterium]|nr:precorrin-6A reductase [Lachnospiraceae bacterium]
MRRTVIFSGTTEGRTISEALSGNRISHTVCVAGEYGREMMTENPYATVHVGRMDSEEMVKFLKEGGFDKTSLIVDATHPYATEVTANIVAAAKALGAAYMRVLRDKGDAKGGNLKEYCDLAGCCKALDKSEGNILLTTGSKELKAYCGSVSAGTVARTYVRVLPSEESLRLCAEAGIESDHIIAMHGPFNEELNRALMLQYDIKHLVTKNSGSAGGFEAKADAAFAAGAMVHVLARPVEEKGVSVDEALASILGKDYKHQRPIKVSLVGLGMGAPGCETVDVREAIESAEVVFGAKRLVKGVDSDRKYEMYKASDIIPVLKKLKPSRAAIIFSGDTGFYSGAKSMAADLAAADLNVEVTVLPGISSFAYLAAKLKESYDDAVLLSLHGKNTVWDMDALARKLRYNKKVFALLSGDEDIRAAAGLLKKCGIEATVIAGRNLSYEDEDIKVLDLEEAAGYEGKGVITALFINNECEKRPLLNMFPDEFFTRSNVPMTKESVRHESIIRLNLKEGDVFYDIGGGTGSIAIEAGNLDSSLKVFTIEKDHEACDLISVNISKANLSNVTVVEGDALASLKRMPKPDAVFVGGSGGELKEIIKLLTGKGKGIRYVINAVSLETITEAAKILEKYEPWDVSVTQLSVSESRKLGAYRLMTAQNPVWIFAFTI